MAGVAIGAFAQTLDYPFVYDDRYLVERNPLVTEPHGWFNVLTAPYWPPEHSIDPLYRPVTTLSLKLSHAIGDGGSSGFRVLNLALHAIATVLVAALARALWNRNTAAWIAGVLFAVHPVHAEVLGLVVGRAELLGGVFVSWMLLRHLNRDAPPAATSVRYHLSTAALFLAALGSKEHAVVAWPAIAMIDLLHRRSGRERRRVALRRVLASHHLGLICALALFLFMRWVVFGHRTTLPPDLVSPFANPIRGEPLTVQVGTAFALLWLTARQWFLGAPLCPIWSIGGFELPTAVTRSDVMAGVVVAAVIAGVILTGWRRRLRAAWPAGLLALAVLLPCHFVPGANWLYAERWAYLPSVFLALLSGGLAAWAPRAGVAGSTLVAGVFAVTTVSYSRCWRNHDAVFEATVMRQPHSYHGLIGLAATRDGAGRLAESPEIVQRLTKRFPDSERAWYYAVLLTAEQEDWEAALEGLRRWGALRGPGPPPGRIALIAERARSHSSGQAERSILSPPEASDPAPDSD